MKKKAKQKSGAKGDRRSPALESSDRRALTKADLLEAAAEKGRKGAPRMRAQASAIRRDLEARLAARNEARALAASMAQQVALEAARSGEGVAVVERSGAVRIKSRDGLKSMHAAGNLDDDLAQAGLAFRLCYETAGSALRVARHGDQPGGGRGDADAAELLRAYRLARLAQFERALQLRDASGYTLAVVRSVAGEGRPLVTIDASGASKAKARKALIGGLAVVAACLPLSLKAKPLRIRAV